MTICSSFIKLCPQIPEFHILFYRSLVLILISYVYTKKGGKITLNKQVNKKLLIFQSAVIFLF
jgi:hypothetical protein